QRGGGTGQAGAGSQQQRRGPVAALVRKQCAKAERHAHRERQPAREKQRAAADPEPERSPARAVTPAAACERLEQRGGRDRGAGAERCPRGRSSNGSGGGGVGATLRTRGGAAIDDESRSTIAKANRRRTPRRG